MKILMVIVMSMMTLFGGEAVFAFNHKTLSVKGTYKELAENYDSNILQTIDSAVSYIKYDFKEAGDNMFLVSGDFDTGNFEVVRVSEKDHDTIEGYMAGIKLPELTVCSVIAENLAKEFKKTYDVEYKEELGPTSSAYSFRHIVFETTIKCDRTLPGVLIIVSIRLPKE